MRQKTSRRATSRPHVRAVLRREEMPVAREKAPRELAGKWVAWSQAGKIIASGETFDEVMKAGEGQPEVSYEHLPEIDRVRGH